MRQETTFRLPLIIMLCLGLTAVSRSTALAQNGRRPKPSFSNVPYGPHERNVVDFYQARSESPTPLLVYFHGGGFRAGDKRDVNPRLYRLCMKNGISMAAANYRLSGQSPYPAQMHDSARAIQFLRNKANDWNIDPSRVAAYGGSAGAGISLWLAFHDDLADPGSADPVLRQSTRLSCAGGFQAQCSYDPRVIREIIPGKAYKSPPLKQLFGLPTTWDWDTDTIDKALSDQLNDASPITHLTNDDPPVFVYYRKAQEVPGNIHHANFGRHLKQAMDALGVKCVYSMSTDYPQTDGVSDTFFDFVQKQFENQ